MLQMILTMTGVAALYVLLTVILWKIMDGRKMTWPVRILIGLVYGGCSVLSTHFGIQYAGSVLNLRDIGPLAAGLYFDPFSGILAGLIGGIERYIAGTYWSIGAYTRIACSVSTCLAGFVAAAMRKWLFKGKKPSAVYAFFMGAVMEVFHMYVVFITHRDDMARALDVVKVCAPPMVIFTGLGMATASEVLRAIAGEWRNPFHRAPKEETPVSTKFQRWLFAVTLTVLLVNSGFAFLIQTQSAVQSARKELDQISADILQAVRIEKENHGDIEAVGEILNGFRVGSTGTVDLINSGNRVTAGAHEGQILTKPVRMYAESAAKTGYFTETVFDENAIGKLTDLGDGLTLMTLMPTAEVYADRDAQAYETALADILLFTVIYMLISLLVQQIVVKNLQMVNASLARITEGDLNEVVDVRESSEFVSLSNDINQTVNVLKGYIDAAERRIEQELEFARTIQDSALPKNFNFPRHEFELYATMKPAKVVGGDFYDVFFVDQHKVALVIADVSGKGIPAALFMMRAKTAIRGLAESGGNANEILQRSNNILCEGNDAEMFVTVWIGIIDLLTGTMQCASAGHEYPVMMKDGGAFELVRDKHGLALAAMPDMKYREYELQFSPGDKLFVYTDGIPEAINEQVEQYGTDRLVQALNAVKDEQIDHILPSVSRNLSAFTGNADQFDDITMLGFTYFGPEENALPD